MSSCISFNNSFIQEMGMKIYYIFFIFLCIVTCTTARVHAQAKVSLVNSNIDLIPEEENLNVFQQWIRWNNSGSLLINHLTKQAMDYYVIRDMEIAKLKTKSDWAKRQNLIKDKLMEIVGPFPEKTPLNPRITGTIKKEGYRIDKIVYESMPGFYVTGCLYVPDVIKGKAPAILNVIGHNQEAFRAPLYQVINYNLVMKGMIVFAIDPPGQGEHVQYFDPKINFSSVGYTVIEHCYFGNQCFLSGSSAARYFIWDGIRAIDYLVNRKDVDSKKIGVTGFSGGGTVTSYISAFDERVKVSIPCSWATLNRRLLETKGGQDGESIFPNGVAEGITFEDLLEVRAPKPVLMTFTSRDEYLCLQGAREAFSEAKMTYNALGREDNLAMVEDDSKHWMTPKIRLAIYSFFMKHFNIQGDPSEREAEILSQEELKVTPTGQISTSLGGDMIFDVNKREAEKLIQNLEEDRKSIEKHLSEVKVKAKEISGFIAPAGEEVKPFINGRYQREGYSVGKYTIMGEGDYAIPILLFVPNDNKARHPALIYLHPQGKVTEAKPGGEIEKLVTKGYVVAAADVIGVGETANTAVRDPACGYSAVTIARSVVGIQAGDIIRVVNYLKSKDDIDPSKIGAVGINEMCIPLIHAAAFDTSISNIIFIGSLISYRSIVMNRIFKIGLTPTGNKGTGHPYEVDFAWGVANVLSAYDLPDLLGCLAPRKVAMADLKDQSLKSASDDLIKQDMSFPRAVYSFKGVSENLKIISLCENSDDIYEWCFK
jgi:cephalosporin-C deacetylase-like acetyl esterase